MSEPARNKDLDSLEPYVRDRVVRLLHNMEVRGFDAICFEAHRTVERQKWLYGYGRTHHIGEKPKTWTLKSRHMVGKAVDVISASRLWDYPAFFKVLKEEANAVGLKVLRVERCHVEW